MKFKISDKQKKGINTIESLVFLVGIFIGLAIFFMFWVMEYTHDSLPLHQLDPQLFWMLLFLIAFCTIMLKIIGIEIMMSNIKSTVDTK